MEFGQVILMFIKPPKKIKIKIKRILRNSKVEDSSYGTDYSTHA